MSIPDFVAFRLRKMRQDVREEVAREINRQIGSGNGAIGPFRIYAQLERPATERGEGLHVLEGIHSNVHTMADCSESGWY